MPLPEQLPARRSFRSRALCPGHKESARGLAQSITWRICEAAFRRSKIAKDSSRPIVLPDKNTSTWSPATMTEDG
jgi:hypothetical protein